ncbi:MAG: autotransporter outer membrane beta-barrel domain-containing protein, partial [Pseudomonadota bacterium]
LPTPIFAALNGATTASEFEATALTLLPAINDGVTREIYEAQRLASAQVQSRLRGEGVGLWGEAFARTADADATSLSSLGYGAETFGLTLGLDAKVGETAKVGILFNYSDIDLNANGAADAGSEIDAFQIGGYAGFDLGQAYVNAEAGYSISSVENERTALVAPIRGESDVDGFYASLNVGYDIDAGGVLITPNGGLRYAELSRDTFTETGGLGLTLDSDSAEFLEARVGLRVASKAESGFIPYASVDYAYDLSSDPLAVAASFNGGADSFTLVADEAGESRFDVGAGFDFVTEGALTVGAEYRGRFASDYQSHSGGVRIRFAF